MSNSNFATQNIAQDATDYTVPAVCIDHLVKQYPSSGKPAVNDLSMTCMPGEIIGLLGHNGAGKSTTLKCLTGMLPLTSGSIVINGFDIKTDPVKAKYTFGFVSDKHDVFVKMTGVQYLNFMADAYGVSAAERKNCVAELDEVFRLGDRLLDPINNYSHGMRQKICMMGSLIHRPKLWILDEPMTGLDPATMRAVQKFMHEYVAQGNAIIFSSHALNTVAKLCDRVVLIQKGEQVDELNVKQIYAANPNFDFEEYFLRNEKTR